MTLNEMRLLFREKSGRTDLVDAAGADIGSNGATFLLNSGQRYLDKLEVFKKGEGILYKVISADAYMTTFQYARAIKEVWICGQDGEDRREELDKVSLRFFMAKYNKAPEDIDSGVPLYYAPVRLRGVPNSTDYSTTLGDFAKYIQTVQDGWGYNGIIIGPPTDTEVLLEIHGLFNTEELSADDDETFWTVEHPEILLWAAMRALEIENRNTQGVRDWENSIKENLLGIGKDSVEEEIADVDQIEG